MEKKKIKPEDLTLNIEVTSADASSPKITETRVCTPTHGTCGGDNGCDTTTPNPTVPDCKTVEEAGCKPSDACLTIEPQCETKVGCVDSASNAVQCCPISDKANTVCANCHTAGTCGADSQCQCLISKNVCESDVITCMISGDDETCLCPITLEEGCKPTVIATEITGCGLY